MVTADAPPVEQPAPELVQIDRHQALGVYESHRFCIRLPPGVSLVDEHGKPLKAFGQDVLVVLIHEYVHYLHNLSTVAGWNAFELFQRVLTIFSHAIQDDGTSTGMANITGDLKSTLEDCLVSLEALEGDRTLRLRPQPSYVVSVDVLDVSDGEALVQGVKLPRVAVKWRATYRDTSTLETQNYLGAHFIDEGVAFLLDEFVRQNKVTFDLSGIDTPPVYPYLAYRTFVRTLAPSITALAAARLGVLALCSHSPGPTLVRALKKYEKLRAAGGNDDDACAQLATSFVPELKRMVEQIVTGHIPEVSATHADRGPLTKAYEIVLGQFRDLLRRRGDVLWFDMEWCAHGTVDHAALSRLLFEAVPCDVVQQREGDDDEPQRDRLLTFGAGEVKDDVESGSASVRALQAQFDYLITHLRTRGIAASEKPSHRKCPFYGSCTLDMRKATPEVCRDAPWRRVLEPATCWYGTAVKATLGTLTVR